MIYIKKVIPMYNEVWLLCGQYGTESKGRIDVKRCGLGIWRGIHNDAPYIIEGSPITPEVFDVDLIVDGWTNAVVPRK